MNSLINMINSYISLHRSEGFGMIAAEAIYLDKACGNNKKIRRRGFHSCKRFLQSQL